MKIRLATMDELSEVVRIVFNAFRDYPLFQTSDPDNDKIEKAVLEMDTKVNIKKHNYFVGVENDKIVAAFSLVPPHQEEANLYQYLKEGGWRLANKWDVVNEIISNTDEAERVLKESVNNDDYWYLDTLAVDPQYQGQHFGSKILKSINQYVKENSGKRLCLLTNTELNSKIYKKKGFYQIGYNKSSNDIETWAFQTNI